MAVQAEQKRWLQFAGVAWLAIVATAGSATPSEQTQCVEFAGALEQGGFIWGKVAPDSTVNLGGEQLDVLPDGTVFAGFGRNAPATAELVIAGPEPCSQTLQVAGREYNIQRVEAQISLVPISQ